MPDSPEADVQESVKEIAAIATSPVLLGILEEIAASAPQDQRDVARRIATRDSLLERGLRVPDDFRISLRYFEEPRIDAQWDAVEETVSAPRPSPNPRPKPHPHHPPTTVCASIGAPFVCVSVGS